MSSKGVYEQTPTHDLDLDQQEHLVVDDNKGGYSNGHSGDNGLNGDVPLTVNGNGNMERRSSSIRSDLGGHTASHMCNLFGGKPTNEMLLWIAFVSFLSFTICQTVASFIAESEAMLGDSAAMLVDSITYAFNLYAEKRKGDPESTRKERLQLELIPPLISVTTLIAVTGYILSDALNTLMSSDDDDDPNTTIMAIFSTANLLLDLVNVFCFAKARKLLGFSVADMHTSVDGLYDHHYSREIDGIDPDDNDLGGGGGEKDIQHEQQTLAMPDDDESYVGGVEDSANLNMCSAYTHVFADTLRSIAVMIAAFVASFDENVSGEDADAVAAIAVSVLIVLSLAPLIKGIIYTWSELQALNALEEFGDDAAFTNVELHQSMEGMRGDGRQTIQDEE